MPPAEEGTMTSPVSDVKPGSPRWRRVGVIVGVAIAVVAGAAIVVGILTVGALTRAGAAVPVPG